MQGSPAILLSIAVIAVFLLLGGGVRVYRAGDRRKGLLMFAAAFVLLVNVLILAWMP